MFRFVLSPGTNSNHCHEGVLLRGTLDNFNQGIVAGSQK